MPATKPAARKAPARKAVKAAATATKSTPNLDDVAAQTASTSGHTASAKADYSAFEFADQAKNQYDALLKSMNDNAEQFSGVTQEMVEAGRASFETAQTHLQEMGTEVMETARQDMSEAVDFANELARAKTVGDALEIQRDYWTRFFETRVERTRTATEKMVEATRETVEPLTEKAPAFPAMTMPMGFGAMDLSKAPGFDTDMFKAFFPFAGR